MEQKIDTFTRIKRVPHSVQYNDEVISFRVDAGSIDKSERKHCRNCGESKQGEVPINIESVREKGRPECDQKRGMLLTCKTS